MKTSTYTYALGLSIALLFAACSSVKNLDRSQVPVPAAPPALNIGSYNTAELDNGLKVIVVENHKIPRVRYQLFVDRGPVQESEKAGYASLAGQLLSAGTTTLSKAEIDERSDFIGASIRTNSSGGSASSLTKHKEELLTLFSDMILNPSFPETELEKNRKQILSGLANATTDADAISGNVTSRLVYGEEHPYGEIETESSIESIQRADLMNFYKTYFKPNAAYLVVVGDITLEEAKADANKHFGTWKKAPFEKASFAQPQAPEGNRVAFVPLDGAVQSVIDVTYPVEYRIASQDYLAANVMNSILGGGIFSGRLMQNLREDKAFTYGARSSLRASNVVGNFSAGASVRSEVTDSAVVEFIYELERMTSELVPDSALNFVKNGMSGQFALSLERPETIARFALNIERYNLPADYYDTYLTRLKALTPDDIMAAAKKYIKPNNAWITVVGNPEIEESLAKFAASGEVEKYDAFGNEYKEVEAAPADVTAADVIAKYYQALGGMDKLKSVKTMRQSGSLNAGGMELSMSLTTKDNNKMVMEMTMGGQVVMGQKFDGTKGSRSQMGQDIPLSEEELEGAKQQADLLYESRYLERGETATLTGIETVNDERLYVIEMTTADGKTSKEYYSVDSGLKKQSVATMESPMGPMTQTTTIKDYKEVKGMLFPSHTVEQVGPQVFEVKIKEIEINPSVSNSVFK